MSISIKETLQQAGIQEKADLSKLKDGLTTSDQEDEAVMQLRTGKWFSKFFTVWYEVWDIIHKYRIDLIIIHKSDMDRKYPIGIEVKLTGKKRGKDLAMWLKQASNYADQNFIGFGKCLIATCPQISDFYLREGDRMSKHEGQTMYANNVGTFIGQFNVGEVQKIDDKDFRIVLKGQVIWDSIYNELHTNNYERLCKR